jgi:hypothetical protein
LRQRLLNPLQMRLHPGFEVKNTHAPLQGLSCPPSST